ncbi:hypothetical protein [Alteraurantiacibacter aquimixticola]|uniref:Transferrin-binding protein B C-lobe/N-lobe beta barrel domain-containing protein n=1 Tax=Alteraurantiacibacter aquimixticola TaxID=2489173 RepID=A0A4T3F031_9SPHN|nr:hypothetical protein [Alteraurantiacibacter aquimixticola]TIX50392.1 hypothetical protein E5222_08945 [Alteraurantiacibacter aquimixticola]
MEFDALTISRRADGTGILATSFIGDFSGQGTISSASNGISGTFTATNDEGATEYSGTFAGSFFGPAAEELGAVASGSSATGEFFTATLAGDRYPDLAAGVTLAGQTELLISQGPSVSSETGGTLLSFVSGGYNLEYDPATDSYLIYDDDLSPSVVGEELTFGGSERAPGRDTPDFDFYVITNGLEEKEFAVFDGSDAEVTLTYANFGRLITTQGNGIGGIADQHADYFGFGLVTPYHQVPRTGLATYSGSLYGHITGGTELGAEIYGSSAFGFDFAASDFIAILTVNTDNGVGGDLELGEFIFEGQDVPYGNGFFGSIDIGADEGSLFGQFYGDTAQELLAAFSIYDATNDQTYVGITGAVQD